MLPGMARSGDTNANHTNKAACEEGGVPSPRGLLRWNVNSIPLILNTFVATSHAKLPSYAVNAD